MTFISYINFAKFLLAFQNNNSLTHTYPATTKQSRLARYLLKTISSEKLSARADSARCSTNRQQCTFYFVRRKKIPPSLRFVFGARSSSAKLNVSGNALDLLAAVYECIICTIENRTWSCGNLIFAIQDNNFSKLESSSRWSLCRYEC